MAPYLLRPSDILLKALSIGTRLYGVILITRNHPGQKIPNGGEPAIVRNLAEMEKERTLQVLAVWIIEISITRAIIQHVQPPLAMSCEDSEGQPGVLPHACSLSQRFFK